VAVEVLLLRLRLRLGQRKGLGLHKGLRQLLCLCPGMRIGQRSSLLLRCLHPRHEQSLHPRLPGALLPRPFRGRPHALQV